MGLNCELANICLQAADSSIMIIQEHSALYSVRLPQADAVQMLCMLHSGHEHEQQ